MNIFDETNVSSNNRLSAVCSKSNNIVNESKLKANEENYLVIVKKNKENTVEAEALEPEELAVDLKDKMKA
eukprot:13525343-Heterocapsa_arctica.AAC.1